MGLWALGIEGTLYRYMGAKGTWLLVRAVKFNTLRLGQNGRHFAEDIFKCIFLYENVWIQIKISLKFNSKGPIYNNPELVRIMAWRQSGDKPLSEPMMVSLLTHLCVTRPQWVNHLLVTLIQRMAWCHHVPMLTKVCDAISCSHSIFPLFLHNQLWMLQWIKHYLIARQYSLKKCFGMSVC